MVGDGHNFSMDNTEITDLKGGEGAGGAGYGEDDQRTLGMIEYHNQLVICAGSLDLKKNKK